MKYSEILLFFLGSLGQAARDYPTPWQTTRILILLMSLSFTTATLKAGDISEQISANGSGRATAYTESNKTITFGNKTHVSWLDSIDDEFRVQVRTLDRSTGDWTDTYTVGTAIDNHGGPAITVDSQGFLHAVYHPHNGLYRYRKSTNPNDASAWDTEILFGDGNDTYPTLVTGPDDTLYLTSRDSNTSGPWELNMYSKPSGGAWSSSTKLIEANSGGYAQFKAALAWGPDHETLHLSTRMYGDSPGWGYLVGYMKSTDFGQSWQKADGTPVTLPALKETLDQVEAIPPELQSSYSDYFASANNLGGGSIAVDANNNPHILYNTLQPDGSLPRQAWIATPDGSGGWEKNLLNHKLDALPAGWGIGMPGGLNISEDGRMSLVLTMGDDTNDPEVNWGGDSNEILWAESTDGGQSFTSQIISSVDPNTPNWLPSIERPTGFNDVNFPSVVYTSGNRGGSLGDILFNDVIWGQVQGGPWNEIEGDINQNGVFFGDGSGPAETDDVTAFIEGWLSTGLPGNFGTMESYSHGDINFNGVTDLDDAFAFRILLGQAGLSGAALAQLFEPVPEPSSLMLCWLAILGLFGSQRNRRLGMMS